MTYEVTTLAEPIKRKSLRGDIRENMLRLQPGGAFIVSGRKREAVAHPVSFLSKEISGKFKVRDLGNNNIQIERVS